MKAPWFSKVRPLVSGSALVVAGCGGAPPAAPAPVGAQAPATMGPRAASAWDPVFVDGYTTTLRTMFEDEPALEVTVTARAPRALADGLEVVSLVWSPDAGAPTAVVRGPAGVQLVTGDVPDEELPAAVAGGWWMPEAEAQGPGGLVVEASSRAGELCFTDGPAPNAGECEDVCFASLCVTPGHGITQVDGHWAPDERQFAARLD
ncbi:MAG: hypothetical protein R2939_04665 [Kofleriaceae bacterium]